MVRARMRIDRGRRVQNEAEGTGWQRGLNRVCCSCLWKGVSGGTMLRLIQAVQKLRIEMLAIVFAAGLQGCSTLAPPETPPLEDKKPETGEGKKPDALKPMALKTIRHIRKVNKTITLKDATAYVDFINEASREFQIDNQMLVALITVESMFNIDAVSHAGAKGLTQVIPHYHQDKIAQAKQKLNLYSIYEPRLNIYVGAWVLRDYLDNSRNLQTALQKYNGSLDDPAQSYANKVLAVYRNLKTPGVRSQ